MCVCVCVSCACVCVYLYSQEVRVDRVLISHDSTWMQQSLHDASVYVYMGEYLQAARHALPMGPRIFGGAEQQDALDA